MCGTLVCTFSTMCPLILLKNFRLTIWSNMPANHCLHLVDFNGLHLDSISAICLLGCACSWHFPELPYIRNPTLKWSTFFLPPGSCQHSHSSNLHHMCSSASARAPSLQSAFLLCMCKLYLVLFLFQNSPTPWIMIPTYFCSFFSCPGLDSLPPCFRQNKLLVIPLILRSHSLKRQNYSITIFSKKGKLSHIKCAH